MRTTYRPLVAIPFGRLVPDRGTSLRRPHDRGPAEARKASIPLIAGLCALLAGVACGAGQRSASDPDAAGAGDAAVLATDGVASDAAAPDAAAPDAASADAASGAARVGDPCTTADSCPAGGSGAPVCLEDWPGGYCAVADCAVHGHDCPEDPGLGGTATTGGKCVFAPEATCLALCGGPGDCRDGYSCEPLPDSAGHGTANVCVPAAP